MNFILPFILKSKLVIGISILFIVLLGLNYTYNVVYERGASSIQVKWDSVEKERIDATNAVLLETIATTKNIQIIADKQRETANAQITNLNKSLNTALNGLSNRSNRPETTSSNITTSNTEFRTTTSCNGTGLYRPDAEFLIRESARAEKLKTLLEQCQNQYNSVKEKYNSN